MIEQRCLFWLSSYLPPRVDHILPLQSVEPAAIFHVLCLSLALHTRAYVTKACLALAFPQFLHVYFILPAIIGELIMMIATTLV